MNQSTQHLLIYGANGYTGQLICAEAARKGLKPIIAGRRKEAIAPLAEKFGWEWRLFSLDDKAEIAKNLVGMDVVLHCAGPFRFTAKNMLEACIENKVHYLDITGEIEVFALAQGLHQKAVENNIMLLPGTGFDVVPTDCLALRLKEKMPDAEKLELAFVTLGGQISHGTASSMVAKLGEGGACRENGRIKKEPLGKKAKKLQLDGKEFFVMSIPWGDVFTAFYTTGIKNVHAYTGMSASVYYLLKLQGLFNPILRTSWFRKWMQGKIDNKPAGPTDEKRARAKSYIWGEVTNVAGEKSTDWFTCPEGYTLTAMASVAIAQKVLNGDWKPGYQTPAGCYGSGLINEIIS